FRSNRSRFLKWILVAEYRRPRLLRRTTKRRLKCISLWWKNILKLSRPHNVMALRCGAQKIVPPTPHGEEASRLVCGRNNITASGHTVHSPTHLVETRQAMCEPAAIE